ncbi:hypothetical protein ACFVHW_16725 [Streptomyces sp. NPDC127110]|uniref:hypothetical protein n=1 Tax=Streptomyces sp. NPDC127110 TaxID=3345362 RepID=UPI003637DF48
MRRTPTSSPAPPDGNFWIYPGDGYGRFNVGKRVSVKLPAGVPDPAEWTQIMAVGDIDLDGKADLVWRSPESGKLWLRFGKPGAGSGSTDLLSAATAGASCGKTDVVYGAGWIPANIPLAVSTPHVNGDRIPDIWAKGSNGYIWVSHPSSKGSGGAVQAVLGKECSGIKAFG